MNTRKWKQQCAQRFIDVAKLDVGEAAVNAEACADLEFLTSGNDAEMWMPPAQAADEEMAKWATP